MDQMPFVVDKSTRVIGLVFAGGWNAYCLEKSPERFVFVQ